MANSCDNCIENFSDQTIEIRWWLTGQAKESRVEYMFCSWICAQDFIEKNIHVDVYVKDRNVIRGSGYKDKKLRHRRHIKEARE